MELSGANKAWLAFGEGEIFNRSNVGKIIQMLSIMQNNIDKEMLYKSFVYAMDFVNQSINSLQEDPARSLVYRVEDLPMLQAEKEALKILATLHIKEEITPAFIKKYSIEEKEIIDLPNLSTSKSNSKNDTSLSSDIEAIIAKTAKATADEIYKKLKMGS
jgi:hypothetical protein